MSFLDPNKIACIALLLQRHSRWAYFEVHQKSVADASPCTQYLFLLFDVDNPVHKQMSNAVFTTEGHYLALDKSYLKPPPKSRRGEAQTCPYYAPSAVATKANGTRSMHPIQLGIPYRSDMEYARNLVGLQLNQTAALHSGLWDINGFCESPSVEDYVVSLFFGSNDLPEDVSPSLEKVQPLHDRRHGYLVRSIQNLRIQITRRMDDKGGYDVTRIGPYRVASGATVHLADPTVILVLKPTALMRSPAASTSQVTMRFASPDGSILLLPATKAAFGPDITLDATFGTSHSRVWFLPDANRRGCKAYDLPPFAASEGSRSSNVIVVVDRGECVFAQKMANAAQAGASAIIVISDEEEVIVPSANADELSAIGRHIPLVLMPMKAGMELREAHVFAEGHIVADLVKPPDWAALSEDAELANTPVIVNGHWLVNCRLVRP